MKYKAMLATYFTAVFLALFHVLTGFGYNPVPDPFPNPQSGPCLQPQPYSEYIVFPQCNPSSGSIFSNAPSVVIFTNTFIQAVYNSDILRQVLDLSQTTILQYSQFVYKYSLKLFDKYGVNDADSLAEFSIRAIAPNFDVLTMPLMVRVKGNTVANFLFVEGILTVDNAESLALTYAEIIESQAQAILTADPTSKFLVIADSFFNFIFSVDDNAIAMVRILTYYFGNEWFVAAVNYK